MQGALPLPSVAGHFQPLEQLVQRAKAVKE
jgi:hypothetical protein